MQTRGRWRTSWAPTPTYIGRCRDSELSHAITVLARAQQDAAWNRGQLSNKLRSHLKQYFPAALAAFQVRGVGLDSREAHAVLAAAPDPRTAAKLTLARLPSELRKSGRQRNIDTWARRLLAIFAAEVLHQLPLVEAAMGRHTLALVMQLDAACRAADDLAEAAAEAFAQHPDAPILTSFPGIGPLTGARVLGEIGDDRTRFRDARGLKSYAGSAPITIASGKSLVVHHRKVKNQRLAAAGDVWIFGALPSPHVKYHYDLRRAAGDKHAAAMRNPHRTGGRQATHPTFWSHSSGPAPCSRAGSSPNDPTNTPVRSRLKRSSSKSLDGCSRRNRRLDRRRTGQRSSWNRRSGCSRPNRHELQQPNQVSLRPSDAAASRGERGVRPSPGERACSSTESTSGVVLAVVTHQPRNGGSGRR